MSNPIQIALISLGSNEKSISGNATETVQKAMFDLGQLSEKPPHLSGLYATPAFPAGSGPDFVNAAMVIFTKLSPTDLLDRLHQIEAAAGRVRTRRWGQRTLDLDLIAVGDSILPDPETQTHWRSLSPDDQQAMAPDELILPHPRLQDRAFVLVPMLEVAADWEHPLLHRSIAQLCAALPDAARTEVVRLGDADAP